MDNNTENVSPAEIAAKVALETLFQTLEAKKNFIFEAGAGAGKTFSLLEALKFLIDKDARAFLRDHKKIACITFTNIAKEQIDKRTDKHPIVHSDTIHGFCWSMINSFQNEIRKLLPTIGDWEDRITEFFNAALTSESGDDNAEFNTFEVLGKKPVIYELGYASIEDDSITLHHDDVVNLMVALLDNEKFRNLLISKYPVIFIDEYQDTFAPFAAKLLQYFVTPETGPLIGFFGDHWQKIYGKGCGKIDNEKLIVIPKNANFRSVPNVVNILNHMRPGLLQDVKDITSQGFAAVYHTNAWSGARRTGSHWAGDLPSQNAHEYLNYLRQILEQSEWDFAPEKTKILMLTHNVLAEEQGYRQLADIFTHNDSFIKKEDKYIEFFVDFIEPICEAYEGKRYGEMFAIIGNSKYGISAHSDKILWQEVMTELIAIRNSGTIGEVLSFLYGVGKLKISNAVDQLEKMYNSYVSEPNVDEPSKITRIRKLKALPYTEIISFTKFITAHTPFATKHSVKGDQFENVLVVVGRGWNQYNFDQMLAWFNDGVPPGKIETFERSRNLFYVACSRPMKRLGILFTQQLSESSLAILNTWFGNGNVIALDRVIPTLN
ncbi:MAG: UvrD-helicase domain-containing protein [Bacteroidota bacterium]